MTSTLSVPQHTPRSSETKGFSTAVHSDDTYASPQDIEHLGALFDAFERQQFNQGQNNAVATEMNLVEAASAAKDVESFDKVLILMRPGEGQHSVFEEKWANAGNDPEEATLSQDYPRDPLLSSKGVGQVLNISRASAEYCNEETGLVPELYVTSPLRRAIQSALLAFPTEAPGSVHNVPWICHGGCMERANGNLADLVSTTDELEHFFPGLDYSLYNQTVDSNMANRLSGESLLESKMDLLQRTDDFLEWIKRREERVIVVSSHLSWLQSFLGFTLQHEPEYQTTDAFKRGEMKAVGIKF
eukprot:CAMPEP_0185728708 /NCGR_PEP_ID=MMETSP1171-20130828/4066_1 /TAXON_ID=374046 /ORGANISM="Helicotheca tamensis, Strain CCMP826" /LENGTH=300 /DNA_ID=CAMNT_0028397445 /DNA_START=323 /DNA_END=1225 /DNA_ORIENTATION=+